MGKKTFKVGVAGGESRDLTVDADDRDAEPWGLDAKLAVVGKDTLRVDGLAKATGAAKFTYDVNRPNMAFAKALRCPYGHARVKAIDATAAQALPGVLAVTVRAGPGTRLTYAGSIVAAVCAESETRLDDALASIRVEYEVLPCVVDATEALAADAPRVDENQGNRAEAPPRRPQGDPEKALAEAEVKVTAEYRTNVQTHVALEPHGSVAEIDAEGNLTLWTSTQSTWGCRRDAAQVAGIPEAKVRVLTEYMGGGFGCKFGLDACDRIAVEFAKQTHRPVKYMNDRREEHLTGGNRPDSVQRLTSGGTKDGTITVLSGETYGTPGNGRGGAGAANAVLYGIPNVRMRHADVSTFAGSQRAFRAPGHPQGVFALESAVDELAFALRMDPLELRRKNDRHPVRSVEWRIGAERIGWEEHRRKVPGSDAGPVKRGLGCAGGTWGQPGGGDHVVNLTVGRDGSVVVMNCTQDLGTGTKTVFAVLVAEELGIAPAAVTVKIGDTNFPAGPASGGSTTASSIGPPAREAALRAKEAIRALVAKEWGVSEGDVRFEGGKVLAGAKDTTFEKACSLLPPEGLAVSGQRRRNYAGFSGSVGGCQFVQAAVDVETGVVRVEKVVAVHDAGRIVDTLTARSQVNGGVIQGISYALFEERRLDRAQGDMVNPTYDTYRILGMADCPEIDVVFMDVANGINNVGMMGLGEPATVPTAAAVANAVFNAIGARVREIPMTPQRVLAALAAAAAKGGGR